jgi:hypothetical protein
MYLVKQYNYLGKGWFRYLSEVLCVHGCNLCRVYMYLILSVTQVKL